jgi:isopenicillin N synthase-like dioxygenase/RNA:NAD 2'-phosphotransferase (TPT1/KptA family)
MSEQMSKVSSNKLTAYTEPRKVQNSGAFVHGTKFENFLSILEHGLKASNCNIYLIDEMRPDGRIPGLKEPPELLIFIDEEKARSVNMEFDYDPIEGSWTTIGIDGVIRPWFFQKIVDHRKPSRGNVLFQSKDDPMLRNTIRKPPPRLVHATFWENLNGIQREGLIPAKNPVTEMRRSFGSLLQGAEDHVYTVDKDQCECSALEVSSKSTQSGYALTIPGFEERQPDVLCTISLKKADEMGLDVVQSSDRDDTFFVKGSVPPELIAGFEPNEPVNLPERLKAKIADPQSFEQIPIINLEEDEATIVKKMKYACEVVGFMQVVGHGVPEELQIRQLELQKRFFQLPEAQKKVLSTGAACPVRGHFGKGGEDLDGLDMSNAKANVPSAKLTDNKEGLDLNGVPWSQPGSSYIAKIFGQPSQMPSEREVPGFRATHEEYGNAMFQLSRKLLGFMALALDQPADFFEAHLTKPVATHRLLHYWPLNDFQKEIGCGEHTDYGLLTILKQDGVGGLQVLNAKDMQWVHAIPIKDAYVVNIGDMLARWTGHHFKSTVHRVVNLSRAERYSSPYFLEPNLDTVITPGELYKGPRSDGKSVPAEMILEQYYRGAGLLRNTKDK